MNVTRIANAITLIATPATAPRRMIFQAGARSTCEPARPPTTGAAPITAPTIRDGTSHSAGSRTDGGSHAGKATDCHDRYAATPPTSNHTAVAAIRRCPSVSGRHASAVAGGPASQIGITTPQPNAARSSGPMDATTSVSKNSPQATAANATGTTTARLSDRRSVSARSLRTLVTAARSSRARAGR